MSRESIAASDPRPSEELIERALSVNDDDRYWEFISIIRARGTEVEFRAAKNLAESDDPKRR